MHPIFLIGLDSRIGPLADARRSELSNTTAAGQREGFKSGNCPIYLHLVMSLVDTKQNY
jgi:hypothetical protein